MGGDILLYDRGALSELWHTWATSKCWIKWAFIIQCWNVMVVATSPFPTALSLDLFNQHLI